MYYLDVLCLVCYLICSLLHIIQIIRYLMDYPKPIKLNKNHHLIKIINKKFKIFTSILQCNNFGNTRIYKPLCNYKFDTGKMKRNFKIKYKKHTW